MALSTQDSRIIIKSSTVTTAVPTVAPSNDHTDGSWSVNDIYKGELYINLADDKIFTRFNSGIIELATSANLTLAETLANGNTTNQLDILSNNSKARLRILDTYSQLDFNDGVGANGQVYIDGSTITLTHTDKVTLSAPIIEVANGSLFKSADANVVMDFGSGVYWKASANGGSMEVTIDGGITFTTVDSFFFTGGLTVLANDVIFGNQGAYNAKLTIANATNSNVINILTGVTSADYNLTLPTAPPAVNGYVLSGTTAGVLSWVAQSGGGSGITIGTTTITSGTTTRILYDNAGVVGEYAISGSGDVVMTTSPTFVTSTNMSYATASTIAIFDGSKNLISATTATYPSLTELSYVKGLSSAVQTQINTKADITDLPYDISGYRKTGTTTFERWYNQSIVCTALTTVALSKDILRYIPLVIPRDCTMEKLGMEITGAGTAGSVVRIELFDSSNGIPNNRVNAGGTILGDSATSQMLTISQALTPGLYFIATNHNSTANITFRAVPVASLANIHGLPNTAGANICTYFYKTQTYVSPFANPATTPDTIATATPPACNFYLSA